MSNYRKELINDIRRVSKKRSGAWFDDVLIEIFDLRSHILIILRNYQGNQTYHYAAQLQSTLNETFPNIVTKVVFRGPAIITEKNID